MPTRVIRTIMGTGALVTMLIKDWSSYHQFERPKYIGYNPYYPPGYVEKVISQSRTRLIEPLHNPKPSERELDYHSQNPFIR